MPVQVTIEEDGALLHPTRHRARVPYGRRLPSRGHLLAVVLGLLLLLLLHRPGQTFYCRPRRHTAWCRPQASSSSHGTLILDLVAEADGFLPDYDGDSQESWENFHHVMQRGGSCGRPAVVGSRGVGVRRRAGTDVSKLRVGPKEPKTSSLPRGGELSWGQQSYLEASKVHKTQQAQVGKLIIPNL